MLTFNHSDTNSREDIYQHIDIIPSGIRKSPTNTSQSYFNSEVNLQREGNTRLSQCRPSILRVSLRVNIKDEKN